MDKRKDLSDSPFPKALALEKLEKEWRSRHYHRASDTAKQIAIAGVPLLQEEKFLVSIALMADTIPQSEEGVIAQTLWDETFQPLVSRGKATVVVKYSIDLAFALIHHGDAERSSTVLELISLYVPDHLDGEFQHAKGAFTDRFAPLTNNVTPLFRE